MAAYGISRSLHNPLPFATINLDRLAAGTDGQLHHGRSRLSWTLGWDTRMQRDNRRNTDGGAVVLEQNERVRSLSLSGIVNMAVGPRLRVTAGARFDAIGFRMEDQHLANGDQSGRRTMSAISPSAGIAYPARNVTFYANVSTAFETPTTTELVNRPDTDGGLHPDLGPQRTRGLEAGLRGHMPRWRLHMDVALYFMRIHDRLLPQEDAEGRSWYTNRGRNEHRGIEVALHWPSGRPIQLHAAVAAGRYVFLNDPGRGLHVPGVPNRQGYVGLRYMKRKLRVEVAADFASKSWADSYNKAESEGHWALDLYAAHNGFTVRDVAIQPFLSVTNVLDAAYSASLIINAFGDRYFEPAPGRALHAGLSMAL